MQLEKAAIAAYEANQVAFNEVEKANEFEEANEFKEANEFREANEFEYSTQALPISWINATESTGNQKFARKITYAREIISRKKSALAKADVGSGSLTNFFPVVEKRSRHPL